MIRIGSSLSVEGPGPLAASLYNGYLTPCAPVVGAAP